MKPGVIILHLTHGAVAKNYRLDLEIFTHRPRDFEWMYKKDKFVWFNNLYANSTETDPVVNAFICTTPDLMKYLHVMKKEHPTSTMVMALIHGENELLDNTTFYI